MKLFEIFFVCIAAILTAFTTYNWKEIGTFKKVTLIVVIVAAILVAINSFQDTRKQKLIEKVNASFGDISDTKGVTIPLVQFGNSGTRLGLLGGVFEFSKFGRLFKLYVKNNRLHFWTVVRGPDGNVVAVIDDNVWTQFDMNYEYNNDDRAFEIVTKGERKLLFQIDYIGGVAKIAGLLLNDKKTGAYFEQAPNRNGGGSFIVFEPHHKIDLNQSPAVPIFKYPRGKYLGVRNNN